ncbi:hypothetical protein GCM10009634_81730 [Saccharothrix xinjiangensis]
MNTVNDPLSASATPAIGPDARKQHAASTSTTAGPVPTRENPIRVPSAEITGPMVVPLAPRRS